MRVMNLVTAKATANHKLLLNKPTGVGKNVNESNQKDFFLFRTFVFAQLPSEEKCDERQTSHRRKPNVAVSATSGDDDQDF
jgi:hypothetical protein